jgi:hypothetical protein
VKTQASQKIHIIDHIVDNNGNYNRNCSGTIGDYLSENTENKLTTKTQNLDNRRQQ